MSNMNDKNVFFWIFIHLCYMIIPNFIGLCNFCEGEAVLQTDHLQKAWQKWQTGMARSAHPRLEIVTGSTFRRTIRGLLHTEIRRNIYFYSVIPYLGGIWVPSSCKPSWSHRRWPPSRSRAPVNNIFTQPYVRNYQIVWTDFILKLCVF